MHELEWSPLVIDYRGELVVIDRTQGLEVVDHILHT